MEPGFTAAPAAPGAPRCLRPPLQGSKKDWIVRKKQQQRSRGYTTIKPDSKYTGRKRKDRF